MVEVSCSSQLYLILNFILYLVNQDATLLGYLAFGSLKKLIKKAQLIDVMPCAPFVTVRVELPFELQDAVVTLLKEDLRGLIKKNQYKIFDMIPHVALDYAKHKNFTLEIVSEDHVIKLLEFEHALVQINHPIDQESLKNESFDLFEVVSYANHVFDLNFALGDDIKNLKKILKSFREFQLVDFLKNAGILDRKELVLSQRGQDVLNYYTQVVHCQLVSSGFCALAENPQDISYIMTAQRGELFEDPLILGEMGLESCFIRAKMETHAKKINSCLKSLIKILKMMSLNFQLHVSGKFPENDLKEITLGIEELAFLTSDTRCLELKVLDGLNRLKTVVKFHVFKKSIELNVDLINLFLTHLTVSKRLYPSAFERPRQVAVYGDLSKHQSLCEAYAKSRLKGESGFILDVKDLLSSKDALDYQIDKMIYFSTSDGMVKEKSYD
jgi:hypothetical protein